MCISRDGVYLMYLRTGIAKHHVFLLGLVVCYKANGYSPHTKLGCILLQSLFLSLLMAPCSPDLSNNVPAMLHDAS